MGFLSWTRGKNKDFEEQMDLENRVDLAFDPLKQHRERLQKEATSYESAIPKYSQIEGTQAAQEGRQALAQQLAGIRSGSQRRGLLYSGLRQGAESQAAASTAAQLAARRAAISRQLQSGLDARKQAAMGAGLQEYVGRRGLRNRLDRIKSEEKSSDSQGMGALFGGIGSLAGSIIGGSGK